MKKLKVVAHTSFLGHGGYNNHSRNFFTHLSKLIPVKVRNYSVCDDLSYLKPEERSILIDQYWEHYDIKSCQPDEFIVNLVLNESHHYFFYHNYDKPMIAYNVWESTRQIPEFFNRILEYDQFWCPTEWQRQCTIDQGYPADRVKVVPEGVNGKVFHSISDDEATKNRKILYNKYGIPEDKFSFMIFGRWDYRKSVTEIIQSFNEEFKDDDNVVLILSADNPYPVDNLNSTEERLKHYGLESDKIKVLHFPPRDEYIQWMKSGHVFLSCARSEGWNLPLIESIACGVPSICSDWGAQLEFADGISYTVNVPEEKKPEQVFMMDEGQVQGMWGEPDFEHLRYVMRKVYNEYNDARPRARKVSKLVREIYTWENAALKGEKLIRDLVKNKYHFVEGPQETKPPKVSFVTSFFNVENFVDELAESVFAQTLKDWEWIVTDDYSSDNTKEKVLELSKKDKRIKYIEQRNKQEVYWNPHKYASGEIIFHVGSDDALVPKAGEVVAHFFDKNPDVSCMHPNANYYRDTFDVNNFKNSSHCKFDGYENILDKHPIYLANESGYERVGFLFGATIIFRNPGSDFNFNDGDFKLGKHEDLVRILRMEEMGHPLFLNRTLYKVRMRTDSNSGSWGDKGGENEFERIYDQANKRRKTYYKHKDVYESIREELYPFLFSELNDETKQKKVSCINFNLDNEKKDLIREIYYDHIILFDEIVNNTDYIFVIIRNENDLTLYEKISEFENKNTIFFFANDDWSPDFYETDGENYFKLFNIAKEYFMKRTPFYYSSYLYKYCFIKLTTPIIERLKLNLGCGNKTLPGFVNIDRFNNSGNVDINADVRDLPFTSKSIGEVHAYHLLEHMGIHEIYFVLEEWKRVLVDEGKLVLKLPNLEREVDIWLNASPETKWKEVPRIFGGQEYEGGAHLCGFNLESLRWFLEQFYFDIEQIGLGNSGYGEEIHCVAIKKAEPQYNPPQIICHFVDGPFIEVLGDASDKGFYSFEFLDPESESIVHKELMRINHWARPHRRYYTDWLVQVKRNGTLIYEHAFDCKDKNILISFDSKSLGDTIAWFPYVEEFRKKHQCNIWVSTFWNLLFQGHDKYKHLNFIKPGTVVDNLYASYMIGCFDNDDHKNKVNWRITPLQKIATDMLGLDHIEMPPEIAVNPGARPPIREKYVTLSEHSTVGNKYWNYKGGWQIIVDYFNDKGFKVMVVSTEESNLKGVINRINRPIQSTITNIYHSEMFLGTSSGPAWVAWALRVPVILVAGSTAPWLEFSTGVERIINENVCTGCFNDASLPFDRGDWEWCPRHKGTPRHYECSKSIEPKVVIDAIERILKRRDK